MPIRYTHTNIIAEDWKKLVLFYQEVFGCELVPPERDQQGTWLDRGTGVPNAHLKGCHLRLPGYDSKGPTLEIYSYTKMEDKGFPLANRKGFGHIAFLVDDVGAIRNIIIANGGRDIGEISQTEVTGVGKLTFIYMADPEGNILEIQHWS